MRILLSMVWLMISPKRILYGLIKTTCQRKRIGLHSWSKRLESSRLVVAQVGLLLQGQVQVQEVD